MCRRTEEVGPTLGLPCHRHFVGFFNVPFQTPRRDYPFITLTEELNPLQWEGGGGWEDWLLNVTFNDISVTHVTAHRCVGKLKKLDIGSGSHAIDISKGSLTCPSKHRNGITLLRYSDMRWICCLTSQSTIFQSYMWHRCAGGLKKK